MTTTQPSRPSARAALTNRSFVLHYLQMLAAMVVGMVVLGPLSMHVVHHPGAEVEMLLMATTMVAGMAAWMVHRRHPWPGVLEMSAAMYAALAVPFPFYWLGTVDSSGLAVAGHLLMLPGMAIAMLHRRENYTAAR